MKVCIPYIYKVIFKPDGRIYIGSKSKKNASDPKKFWVEGGYYTTSNVVKDLILEYGTSSDIWSVEILETFSEERIKEVREKENEYIVKLVNDIGAENVLNKKWVVNGRVHNNTGIPHTEETKEIIKQKAKGRIQAINSEGKVVRITLEEFATGNYIALAKGTKFFHNPETGDIIKLRSGVEAPEGYIGGMGIKQSEERKELMSNLKKSSIWITDGINSKSIKNTEEIPEGWKLGRVIKEMPGWSEERRAKRKATMDRKTAERLAKKALEPKKERKAPRKRTPEEIEANKLAQKLATQKRKELGIPHGNKKTKDND